MAQIRSCGESSDVGHKALCHSTTTDANCGTRPDRNETRDATANSLRHTSARRDCYIHLAWFLVQRLHLPCIAPWMQSTNAKYVPPDEKVSRAKKADFRGIQNPRQPRTESAAKFPVGTQRRRGAMAQAQPRRRSNSHQLYSLTLPARGAIVSSGAFAPI